MNATLVKSTCSIAINGRPMAIEIILERNLETWNTIEEPFNKSYKLFCATTGLISVSIFGTSGLNIVTFDVWY